MNAIHMRFKERVIEIIEPGLAVLEWEIAQVHEHKNCDIEKGRYREIELYSFTP